jgi:ABC-type multidrug transport system fused ATPase/permease subunit
MQRKTVLFITHRLVHLENLNQILVMDGGMVVQRGSHDELAAGPGLYGRLRAMQIDSRTADA